MKIRAIVVYVDGLIAGVIGSAIIAISFLFLHSERSPPWRARLDPGLQILCALFLRATTRLRCLIRDERVEPSTDVSDTSERRAYGTDISEAFRALDNLPQSLA